MTLGAITITRAPVDLDDLVAVADGAPVAVADDARQLMTASRDVVTEAMRRGEQIYGVSAGLGHARDQAVPAERIRAMQADMVRMHAGAFGPALPRRVVRAVMAARLVGITRGGSGASIAVADALVALLNHDIVPVAPTSGSVGASDLGHHALIGLVALGEGTADVAGRVVSGADALREAGVAPLVLAPKDGIALISSNGVTLGHGALVLARARQLLALADAASATSLDAIRGNPSVLSAVVHEAKGSRGQRRSAARMRAQVSGSDRVARPASLQDPLSFRVAPQVHGACEDVLDAAVAALETELNARTDNPLADVGSHDVISNGNFHPMLVALSFESVRVALAHVTQLSDRRLGQIWDAAVDDLLSGPASEAATAPVWAAGLLMRYASAARATTARRLAEPVTLDVPPLDRAQEDHATNAPAAVSATDDLLDVVADVLAVETLAAYARLHLEPEPRPGLGTARVAYRLDGLLGDLGSGVPTADVQRRVRDRLVALYLG